jgi:hypothetical protein
MNKTVSLFNELRDVTNGLNESQEFLNMTMDREFMDEWACVSEQIMCAAYLSFQEKRMEIKEKTLEAKERQLDERERQLNNIAALQPYNYLETDLVKKAKKTLVLHNLPRHVKVGNSVRDSSVRELTEIIRRTFKHYGIILDVYLPLNKDNTNEYKGTMKGFALLKFKNIEDAEKAYERESNRMYIYNNMITLEYAKEDRDRQIA